MSGRKLVPCLLTLLMLLPLLAAPASFAQAGSQDSRRAAAFGIEVRQGRKAMPGVEVRLESEGPVRGTSPEPKVTDAEGRAEFWWLTPGIWRVDLVIDGEVAYFLTVRIDPGRRAEEMGSPARDVDAPDLRWKFFRPRGEPPPPPPPPRPEPEPEPEPVEPEAAEPEAAEPPATATDPDLPAGEEAAEGSLRPPAEPMAEPEPAETAAEPPAAEPAPPEATEPETPQPEPEQAPAAEPATPEPTTPEPATPEPAEEPEAAAAPEPAPEAAVEEEAPAETVTPPPMIPDPTPPPTEDPTDEPPELAVEPEEEPERRVAEEPTPPPMIPAPTPPPTGEPAEEESVSEEPEPAAAPEPEAPETESPRETAPEAPIPTEPEIPEPPQPAVPQPDPQPVPAIEDAAEELPVPAEREPAPVEAAPVEPAPQAGPRFTSGSGAGGDCPECKSDESALTLARTVPPGDPGGGATCGPDMARAALAAARRLAVRGQGLGPGMPLDGGEVSSYTGSGASCQLFGVVLPPGVRYRGYTYSVETGGDAGGPCYLPRACPVAGAVWTARPVIEELENGSRMVYGVFRNASAVPLRAELQVFYVED